MSEVVTDSENIQSLTDPDEIVQKYGLLDVCYGLGEKCKRDIHGEWMMGMYEWDRIASRSGIRSEERKVLEGLFNKNTMPGFVLEKAQEVVEDLEGEWKVIKEDEEERGGGGKYQSIVVQYEGKKIYGFVTATEYGSLNENAPGITFITKGGVKRLIMEAWEQRKKTEE